MYCKYCGIELEDGSNFCIRCGNKQTEPAPTAPVISAEERSEMRKNILGWGITSLAFASTMILSFLGFIFAIVAKAKAKKYYKTFGVLDWQAKVGNHLAKAGFGVGLGFSILWFCYIGLIILAIILSDNTYTPSSTPDLWL